MAQLGPTTIDGEIDITQNGKFSGTGSVKLPTGTTAERPTPDTGMMRYNTENTTFEGYNGTEWGSIGGGGPALGTQSIIRTNAITIDENITIPQNTNGTTAGPITISDGYTVTIEDGSTWTVL